MKKTLLLTLVLTAVFTSFAFAKDVKDEVLTENSFSQTEGGFDFSSADYLSGYTAADDLIHIKDIESTLKTPSVSQRGTSLVMQKGNFNSDYAANNSQTYLSILAGKKDADGNYGGCDTEVVFEFDFLNNGLNSPERIKLQLCGEKGGEAVADAKMLNICNTWFAFNEYTTGQKAVTYVQNTWYRVKFAINLKEQKYTFDLYKDDGSLQGSATGALNTPLDSLTELKLWFNTTKKADDVGVDKYFAFDNLKVTYKDIMPNISSVWYKNEGEENYTELAGELPKGIKNIRLFLDGPIKSNGELFESIDVCLKNLEKSDMPEKPKSFKYSKTDWCIDLEFASALKPGVEYQILFNDKALTSFGNSAKGVSKTLVVEKNALEAKSCTFDGDGEVTATIEFENSSAETSVLLVAAVWQNNLLKSLKACEAVVAAGGTSPQNSPQISAQVDTGETMEIYVLDSLSGMKSITEKIFSYKK